MNKSTGKSWRDRFATDPYDANGNLVSQVGIQNGYDFENQLIQHSYMKR